MQHAARSSFNCRHHDQPQTHLLQDLVHGLPGEHAVHLVHWVVPVGDYVRPELIEVARIQLSPLEGLAGEVRHHSGCIGRKVMGSQLAVHLVKRRQRQDGLVLLEQSG